LEFDEHFYERLVQMQIYNIPMTQDLEELTPHGSNEFQLVMYETLIVENIYGHIPIHWHEDLQLILVTNGTVQFRVDSEEYIIGTHEGIVINTGWLHSARSYNGADGAFLCINFHPEFFYPNESQSYNRYVKPVIKNPYFKAIQLELETPWQNKLIECIKKLRFHYDADDDYNEIIIRSIMFEIWYDLLHNIEAIQDFDIPGSTETSARINTILEYIHENYSSKISLLDLAAVANLSRSECCRSFKKQMAATPFEYINRYRLAQSMSLLRLTDMSVTEISHEVGFNSPSLFISSFKKLTGLTPAKYRKLYLPVL